MVRPDVDRSCAGDQRTGRAGADPRPWRRRGPNSGRPGSSSRTISVISLAPLDEAEVQRMIAETRVPAHLSAQVMKRVSERAGGVPLFVEEVTRLILERGEQGAAQAIPPTLATVAGGAARPAGTGARGRADRRGPGAELLLSAPARGRVSRRARRSGGLDEASLKSALGSLVDADLLFVDGDPAGGDLSLQTCADSGRGLRQPLEKPSSGAAQTRGGGAHRRSIGAGGDRPSFHRRRRQDLAIEWWGNAGEEALRRSAFKEAIAHLGKAIALADEAEREAPARGPERPGSFRAGA